MHWPGQLHRPHLYHRPSHLPQSASQAGEAKSLRSLVEGSLERLPGPESIEEERSIIPPTQPVPLSIPGWSPQWKRKLVSSQALAPYMVPAGNWWYYLRSTMFRPWSHVRVSTAQQPVSVLVFSSVTVSAKSFTEKDLVTKRLGL